VHPTSEPRRVHRARRGRILGGVARGIGDHLGWSATGVRALFVALTLVGGLGIVLYAAYWIWLPVAPEPGAPEQRGRDLTGVLGLGALGVGIALALSAVGLDLTGTWITPLLLVAVGLAVLWRQSDESRREVLRADLEASARATTLTALRRSGPRILVGVALVMLGVFGAVLSQGDIWASLRGLAAALLAVAGVGLVLLPFVLGWVRDLTAERRARIRSEERAEVAAQVHDSVLQTLTLIQRAAHDPDEVVRLARTEERALRRWLYAPVGDPAETLVAAVEAVAADVESVVACSVEVVSVGDVDRDDRVDALVAAAREAVLNAAKHAGGTVSVYVECSPTSAEVYIRDRGAGFDPESVPEDRLGLRESVIGRMDRVGGRAMVRSTPGEGTEIALHLPLSLPARSTP
jgi:signal transduction histidine kinase/phage shock protein PspC (stress-responsive transcriptional regulator)